MFFFNQLCIFCLFHVHVQKERKSKQSNRKNDKKREPGFTLKKKRKEMNDNDAFVCLNMCVWFLFYVRQRIVQTLCKKNHSTTARPYKLESDRKGLCPVWKRIKKGSNHSYKLKTHSHTLVVLAVVIKREKENDQTQSLCCSINHLYFYWNGRCWLCWLL